MGDYGENDDEYYFEELSDNEISFQEVDDFDSSTDKRCHPKVNLPIFTSSGVSLCVFDGNRSELWVSKDGFKVITKESLLSAQKGDMNRVMDMLSVGQHHARTLLIHFRWNVAKIFELYVNRGVDKLFAAAGVEVALNLQSLATESLLTCEICIDDKPGNKFTVMDCGHYFCNECWTEHFTVKINEGQGRRINCMAHKCNTICDSAKVESLLNSRDHKLAEKFNRFLTESYVEDNSSVKWCPSVPHCGNAIRVDDLCEVECSCGLQFCFSCSSEAHSPCTCMMWELWVKKCQEESETVKWLTVNAKMCPKCRKFVEKNGGCNLVHCICGQNFCWLCGGETGRDHTWTSIAGHSCGRYADSEQKAKDAKHELQRYLHYFNRYKAHLDSCKLEAKLKEKIHLKLVKLEYVESIKQREYSWVTNAVNRLFRSRWILSLSYPFAFYMFGDELFKNEMTKVVRKMKQELFEDQQQQLEANIEKLSMCLDEPFETYDEDKINQMKMQILTVSTVVDSLCRNMYGCIENDLLGSLERTNIFIAPYNSNGVEKAKAL